MMMRQYIKLHSGKIVVGASLVGVAAEQLVLALQGVSFDPQHGVFDLGVHGILNMAALQVPQYVQSLSQRSKVVINTVIDGILHMVGKYGGHVLYHHLTHKPQILQFGQKYIDQIHHSHSIDMITLSITACLIAEQCYKYIQMRIR